MRTSTAVVILAIIVLLGLGWWWYAKAPAQTPAAADLNTATQPMATTSGTETPPATSGAPTSATVHLTASGFNPASVTVATGGTVTFINDTTGGMWVASDVHPTHTDYDGTSRATHCAPGYSGPAPFDECKPGSSFTFTFTKTGSFTYHNHASASEVGTVVVQ